MPSAATSYSHSRIYNKQLKRDFKKSILLTHAFVYQAPRYERKHQNLKNIFLRQYQGLTVPQILAFSLLSAPHKGPRSVGFVARRPFTSPHSSFPMYHRCSSLRPPDSCQAGAPAAIFTTHWAHSCQSHLPDGLLSPAQTSTHFSSDRTTLDAACLAHTKSRVLQVEDAPAKGEFIKQKQTDASWFP